MGAGQVTDYLYRVAKQASLESSEIPEQREPLSQVLGGLAQLWKSPTLERHGVPQHPSSLGQMLVLGGLGALAGNLGGRVVDHFVPMDAGKASRLGTMIGGLAGMTPGILSALLNGQQGKSPFMESFYSTKESNFNFGGFNAGNVNMGEQQVSNQSFNNQFFAPINVDVALNDIWNDQRLKDVPLDIRAAASGLVTGAANRPDRVQNSPFVTPLDITKMAVGMGSGMASGWLVGKTMGALFGTGQKTQELLKNTGLAAGLLRTVIPAAYGYPY
jgi:hypothetical protein